MNADLLDDALKLISCGVSVIPLRGDGSKRPAVSEWTPYQERLATPAECVEWFSDGRNGIAAICGPVSGGLEVMDFDVPGKPNSKTPPAWKPWCEMLKEHGHDDLLERLVICSTPSGGRHVVYRCKGLKDGNMKLAQCEDSKPLIETRGVGGYFAIAPTANYSTLRGSIRYAPEITEAEREILHVCARLLTEKSDRVAFEKNYPAGKRPGDDYNLRGESMNELLMRHGWRPVQGREGRWANFTRPDKQEGISGGISASTGLFHAFTTSTPFDAGKGYSKFSVYTVLDHAGDFVMAARTLGEQGFGERSTSNPYGFQAPAPMVPDAEKRKLVKFGERFDAVEVEFLWEPYFPVGKMVLLDAEGGAGKSSLMIGVAAGLSIGQLPCGEGPCEPRKILYLHSGEDTSEELHTVYLANGGDASMISYHAEAFPFDNAGIEYLRELIEESGASLVIVDSLFYFLIGAVRETNDAFSVLPTMQKLQKVYRDTSSTGVHLRHTKKGSVGVQASELGMGTVQFRNSHRGQLMMRWHPDNRGVVVVTDEKGSILVRRGEGFQFKRQGLEIQYLTSELNPFSQDKPTTGRKRGPEREACDAYITSMLESFQYVPVASAMKWREENQIPNEVWRNACRARDLAYTHDFCGQKGWVKPDPFADS